jgi:hypothetical protein
MNEKMNEIQWSGLLKDAVKRPGSILEAYSNFHSLFRVPDYSESCRRSGASSAVAPRHL